MEGVWKEFRENNSNNHNGCIQVLGRRVGESNLLDAVVIRGSGLNEQVVCFAVRRVLCVRCIEKVLNAKQNLGGAHFVKGKMVSCSNTRI